MFDDAPYILLNKVLYQLNKDIDDLDQTTVSLLIEEAVVITEKINQWVLNNIELVMSLCDTKQKSVSFEKENFYEENMCL